MRATPKLLLPLAIALAAPAAAQWDGDGDEPCRVWRGNGSRQTHCEVREARVASRATLAVDAGRNGGITVDAHDGPAIEVRARVQAWAPTEARAREIARQVRIETDGTLRAYGPDDLDRSGWAVNWHVRVPRRTALDLETHNGPINVRGVAGRIQMEAHNGPLNLVGLSGEVRGRTRNGPLNVTLSGTRWTGAGLDVETTNGPVNLQIPRNYSAELETGTVNGPMNLDLEQPIPVRGRITRRLRTTLGNGGPPVRAVTTNGPVVLENG